ncbi:MAG: CapA family protein [Enhygromyxa sp.]
MPRLPTALLTAPLLTLLSICGCLRDNNSGKVPNSSAQLQNRVGNDDPRGVEDQPNWDQQAAELRRRVDPRMPKALPSDKRAACTQMLDEVEVFYRSVESGEQREQRIAELADTRERDLEGCVRETSVAAAVCVTILLRERDSEFPWLLDQCSRAYPSANSRESSGGPLGAAEQPEPRAEAIELTFVGDVIFGRYREDNLFDPIVEPAKVKPDQPLAGPFAEVEAALRSDVVVGNLETPVIEVLPQKSPIGSKFRFGGGRSDVQMLAAAGFDVLSLANNHYFDLREEGQLQTPKILGEEGIFPIGASRTEEPLYRVETHSAQGWTIGFVAVTNRINAPVRADTPQVPYIELVDMVATLGPLLEQARADHDLLIVAVHWGDEYAEAPSSYHQKAARGLIDAGADLLIGHHPHVLQGIEQYKDGLIAYSMGNFLFENTGSIPRQTGVLRTRFTQTGGERCLEQVVFHPAYVKRTPYPHPTPATGGMGKQVRGRVISQAKALGSSFVQVEGSEDLRLEGLPDCGGEGAS